MRLKRFRVRNYKKIEDSGWIDCGDMTGFVGKNESGKSALFRGLSKFNPSDGKGYVPLEEFPRRRYSAEHDKEDWPVSSVEFYFDEKDTESLSKIWGPFHQIEYVLITRHYSGNYRISFPSDEIPTAITTWNYLESLKRWKAEIDSLTAPEGMGEALGAIKQAVNPSISQTIQSLEGRDPGVGVSPDVICGVSDAMAQNLNEKWQQDLFAEIAAESRSHVDAANSYEAFKKAKRWIMENMPQFIYFDKYDMIDSAVHMKDFIRQVRESPDDPRLRITKCLFQHVNLDVDKLSALNPNDAAKTKEELMKMASERSIDLSSASTEMTARFGDWWEQRKHRFSYKMDGDIFKLWVSDDLDPSEIELGQRSSGLQYFFSFYLVFLVEAERTYKNSILLLDEPGLYYHGTAQKKMVEFLAKISRDNQLMYTTHSPFMIDGDRLEDVRIVYEDDETGNSRVSTDVWPRDKDSLFPLQAGLGYELAQTLFVSRHNLVVEGLTDYMILQSMSNLLGGKDMEQLDPRAVIMPAAGVSNMLPLASLLLANKMSLAFLLDGDKAGLSKAKALSDRLSLKCMLASSFSDTEGAEMEDLFPEALYMRALKKAYPGSNIEFSEEEKRIPAISDRVERASERAGIGKFEKWKVARALADIINREPGSIPEGTCRTFERIFAEANRHLGLAPRK